MPRSNAQEFIGLIVDLDELDICQHLDETKKSLTKFVQRWDEEIQVEFSRAVFPGRNLPVLQCESRAVAPESMLRSCSCKVKRD